MFRVQFSEVALAEIIAYVDSYRRGYCELFSDSGIWSEKAIIEQYELAAQTLFDSLFSSMKQLLSSETVLGRSSSGKQIECHFHLSDRLVIIAYTQNMKKRNE